MDSRRSRRLIRIGEEGVIFFKAVVLTVMVMLIIVIPVAVVLILMEFLGII